MSVTGNLTIIILTFMDSHLKTPMYFSFKNFAFLEVSFTMVCSPRFLYSIISGNNTITFNTWRSEVKFAQSCPTLWDSKYCSPPGSSVHGVLQARIMEWVAIPFSRGSSQPRDRTWVSCIAGRCFIIWTIRGLMPVLVKYFLLDSLESQHFFFWQSRPVTTMWPSVNPFMNSRVCIIFVLCCWISGLMIVITPLSMGLWIEFCDSSAIHHFGCDAGPLLKISSSDTWFIEQIIMICGVVTFIITLIGAFIVTLIGVFLIYMCIYIYIQFSFSGMPDSLWPHEPQHCRPPCPSPTPRVYPNSCPLSQWYHPTILSCVVPFSSFPQSFPASGSFQMSQLFASGGQSIRVSASLSVLLMNTQD